MKLRSNQLVERGDKAEFLRNEDCVAYIGEESHTYFTKFQLFRSPEPFSSPSNSYMYVRHQKSPLSAVCMAFQVLKVRNFVESYEPFFEVCLHYTNYYQSDTYGLGEKCELEERMQMYEDENKLKESMYCLKKRDITHDCRNG